MKPTFTEKDARKYRKALVELVKQAQWAISYLDVIGKGTREDATGRAIASVCNQLEFKTDFVRHFTLGQTLKPKRADR